MDYTMTQTKRLRLNAIKRERSALKSSMLKYRAEAGRSSVAMRTAQMEAQIAAAKSKRPPEPPQEIEEGGN